MTKVAFVHDWLDTYRGGEKVLELLLRLYPEAPIYTLFYDPKDLPKSITQRQIHHPKALEPFKKVRKLMLPLLPAFIESMPLENYDLVISTSSCVAKGVITGPEAKHLCYIHSPMRYIWDQREHYIKDLPLVARGLMHLFSSRLRTWDVASSARVDHFVANSSFVKKRVEKYYAKKAEVVNPPVELSAFAAKSGTRLIQGDYFLAAGAFVSYKRLDLAIKACEKLGKKLIIAGSGAELANYKKIAPKYTEFMISPNRADWTNLFQHAEAFIFPALEDFGITAIEALASGTPLIAYRAGGAIDFVREGITGEFFEEQTVDSLEKALAKFDKNKYDEKELKDFAENFSEENFLEKMKTQISLIMESEGV